MEVRPFTSLDARLQGDINAGKDRTSCPSCAGGSSREASLSIRRIDEHTLKLSCWRSTCGYWAIVMLTEGVRWNGGQQKPARVYDKPTRYLADVPEMHEFLSDTYGLRLSTMLNRGWKVGARCGELVMPVYDRYGREIGTHVRTFETPKFVDTYKHTARPLLDVWVLDDSAPVVIVEDMLSACRLYGLGFSAVALMGTNVSTADAYELAAIVKRKPTLLALDNDAFEKAIRHCARHKHIVSMQPLLLDKDIKNMENDDDIRLLVLGPQQ